MNPEEVQKFIEAIQHHFDKSYRKNTLGDYLPQLAKIPRVAMEAAWRRLRGEFIQLPPPARVLHIAKEEAARIDREETERLRRETIAREEAEQKQRNQEKHAAEALFKKRQKSPAARAGVELIMKAINGVMTKAELDDAAAQMEQMLAAEAREKQLGPDHA
jgi:uncharacterized small protein (DUF1192 family)